MDSEKTRVTSGSLIDVIRRLSFRFDMETFEELGADAKFVVKLLASKHFVDISSGQVIPLADAERLQRTESNAEVTY